MWLLLGVSHVMGMEGWRGLGVAQYANSRSDGQLFASRVSKRKEAKPAGAGRAPSSLCT